MPTLREEIGRDWQYFDGREEVTIRGQHPDGPAVANVQALQGEKDFKEVQGGTLGVDPVDAAWSFWDVRAVGLPDLSTAFSREPKAGDLLIQADGTVWEIMSLSYSRNSTGKYRAMCKKRP
jgi:hypothetical protein